jgi:hypothetical protein
MKMLTCIRWRTLAIVGTVGLLLASGRSRDVEEPADDGTGLPQLAHLDAGLSVAGAVPKGWTHRVIRSLPRLASGEIATLPDSAKASATLFRTVILAQVTKGPRGHALSWIGVGNAVPFGDREVIITPEGPEDVRASLSTVERIVANAADSELKRGRIVARSPTFALFRTPAKLVINGAHRDVDLYYALLVDPETGAMKTLTWATPAGEATHPRRVVALPPDARFDCALDVAVNGRVGPLNVSWSFAMADLPEGRRLDVPADSARTIGEVAAGRGEPATLERIWRELAEPARRDR